MYEVGIALACRQPQEVLLIRDDNDNFLFDVSTIPHMQIDFEDVEKARLRLHEELMARIRERNFVNDARVKQAFAALSKEELQLLSIVANYSPGVAWGHKETGTVDFMLMTSIPRLLDKGVIVLAGKFSEGHPAYVLTQLGFFVAKMVQSGQKEFVADPVLSTDMKSTLQQEEKAAS
jgi:hypothetical protein